MARKKISSFDIELDKPDGVYRTGETIHGAVLAEVTETLKIRGIRLRFRGKAVVRWSETDQSGIGITRMSSREDYTALEKYFDNTVILTGKEDITLEPNRYRYPFTFKLKPGLPTSYEGKHGRIRYSVDSTVDIPWARDKRAKKPFTVLSTVDLNKYQDIRDAKEDEEQKVFGHLCCAKNPVRAELRLEKIGYVPGEAIRIQADVSSSSNRVNSTEAHLMQLTRYHAYKNSKFGTSSIEDTKVLSSTIVATRRTGQECLKWRGEQLQVPAVPPTNKKECSIIDILYRLMFVVKVSGHKHDLRLSLPLVIGNVPISDMFSPYRPVSPKPEKRDRGKVAKSVQPALLFPMVPVGVPSPALMKSVMGKAVMDDSDSDEDDETKEVVRSYAPAYEFFDWKNT